MQIYEQIKTNIFNKTLHAHEQLPSKRELAIQLNVSVHTIKESYEQLLAEGYIYSKQRRGYFVSPFEFEWLSQNETTTTIMEKTTSKLRFNFRNGQVDANAFPYQQWRKLGRKHIVAINAPNGNWQGEYVLREQIAKYVERARGFHCDPTQIYIYSGTQNQLQALCHFFGDVQVGLEEPGFKRARSIFLQCRVPVTPIVVDESGVTVPQTKINILYTTPAHQFPLGMVMSFERRTALLKWASEQKAFIIEDDYDSEFRYKGSPIPSLAQMDQLQRVIYFGSFSKTLLPSLRISYMILPKSIVKAFNKYNDQQKSSVSKIDQQIIADFIAQELYAKHIAKMRTLYRKKRIALINSIQDHLGDKFTVIGEYSGLHIVLQLPSGLCESEAIARARNVEVAVDPISTSYQTEAPQNMVILGYGELSIHEITEGIKRLASVWKD